MPKKKGDDYVWVLKYALTSEIRKSMFETLRLILYANHCNSFNLQCDFFASKT